MRTSAHHIVFALLYILLTPGLSAQVCVPNPGLDCENASLVCSMEELDGFICRTPPPANPSGPTPLCPGGGAPNNTHWIGFVAESFSTTIVIEVSNCTRPGGQSGLQVGIYEDCSFTNAVICKPECVEDIIVLDFNSEPCKTYYLFLDGCSGSECDYAIQVLEGIDPSVHSPGRTSLILPDSVLCENESVCFIARSERLCVPDFYWRVNGDTAGITKGFSYCHTFEETGPAEICVKAFTGKPGDACQEDPNWTCRTIEVIGQTTDTVELGRDTVCLKPDQRTFITVCNTIHIPGTGSERVCCTRISPSGCRMEYCGDYYFRRETLAAEQTVYLCSNESYITPQGEEIRDCGSYSLRLDTVNRFGCDSILELTVFKSEPIIELTFSGSCGEEQCVTASVRDECAGPDVYYRIRWFMASNKRVLAEDTNEFCPTIPGEYCLELTPEIQGKTCATIDTCFRLDFIIPGPGLSCDEAVMICDLADLDNFSCTLPIIPNFAGPVPLCPGGGGPENIHWFEFTAQATTTAFQVSTGNCTVVGGRSGIQIGVYTDCGFTNALVCQPNCFTGTQIIRFGTQPCEKYYLFVDGCFGSICEYTIDVIEGLDPGIYEGDIRIELPDTILCAGGPVCFNAISEKPCTPGFIWRINGEETGNGESSYCHVFDTTGVAEVCVRLSDSENLGCYSTSEWFCREILLSDVKADTIQLPADTVCLAVDQELFFTRCGTSIRPDSGLQWVCCTGYDPNGCPVVYCADYFFSRELGKETVFLCEGESFVAPDGQVFDSCGFYEVIMPVGQRTVCDSVADYQVVQPEIEIRIDQRGCQSSLCYRLNVSDRCSGIELGYQVRWTDGRDGSVIAEGVRDFCPAVSGIYCVEVTPVYNGKTCGTVDSCFTTGEIIPIPGRSCNEAAVICDLGSIDMYSCRTPAPPNPDGPVPLCPAGGVPNNMQWWTFVAGSDFVSLRITADNCTRVGGQMGIQAGVYTDCSYQEAVACLPGCWEGSELLQFNAIPCQQYFLFIDGCNGSECDYVIEVLAGGDPLPEDAEVRLMLPDTIVCSEGPVCFEASSDGSCPGVFLWRIDGDTLNANEAVVCDTFISRGIAEVCVKFLLNENFHRCASSSDWVCRMLRVVNPTVDTIYLPRDTICLEPDQEFFTTTCGTEVPVMEGVVQICCTDYSAVGCIVEYCAELFFVRREMNQRSKILLCEGEIFIAANGDTLDRCGEYIVVVQGQGPFACDQIYEYTVSQPLVQISTTVEHCVNGKSCIEAEVTENCDGDQSIFSYRWLEGESGRELAKDVLSLCVDRSGEYCLEVTPRIGSKDCDPVIECVRVVVPVPAAPAIRGQTYLCGQGFHEVSVPVGAYRGFEWTISDGRFNGADTTRVVQLDLRGASDDTIRVCVRVRYECGFSDSRCRDFFSIPAPPTADFTYSIMGDSVFFMASARDGVTYSWRFGDGSVSSERDPKHRYTMPGEYDVRLIVRNPCYSESEVKRITIRMTSTGDLQLAADVKVFPNPGEGLFTLRSDDPVMNHGEILLRVTDIAGRLIGEHRIDGQLLRQGWKLDLTGADAGVYHLLAEGERAYFVGRLVVTR